MFPRPAPQRRWSDGCPAPGVPESEGDGGGVGVSVGLGLPLGLGELADGEGDTGDEDAGGGCDLCGSITGGPPPGAVTVMVTVAVIGPTDAVTVVTPALRPVTCPRKSTSAT